MKNFQVNTTFDEYMEQETIYRIEEWANEKSEKLLKDRQFLDAATKAIQKCYEFIGDEIANALDDVYMEYYGKAFEGRS